MKKQLLQETEIRKMMKFANIGSLTDGFVDRLNETFEMQEADEDEDMEAEPDLGGEEDPGDEMDATPAEPAEPDMDMVGDPGGAAAPSAEGVVRDLGDAINKFKSALEQAGPEGAKAAEMITLDQEDAPEAMDAAPEPDMGMGAEPDMGGSPDLGDMGAPTPDMGDEKEMEEGMYGKREDELDEDVDESLEEEMLEEVARRVARRLTKMRRRRS